MNGYAPEGERKDLTLWRERRMHEASARKPRSKSAYIRKTKHGKKDWK